MSSSLLATCFYTKLSANGHTPVYFSIISVPLWYLYIVRTPGLDVPEQTLQYVLIGKKINFHEIGP